MRFRPCIDIHNGKVKQIVGGSLTDEGDQARENFISEKDAAWFARYYAAQKLTGGHIILLNPASSPYFPATREQAIRALQAAPGSFQIGGGITDENAADYLRAGASHVIVTSYVFQGGRFQKEHLDRLLSAVGREHLVLDLSCRRKSENESYYIVTDRWQTFTDAAVTRTTLESLADCCDEFLIHGVDAEGKKQGIEEELVRLMADAATIPMTYAGGVGSFADLERVRKAGRGRVDVTIGSALDLFGGDMAFSRVLEMIRQEEENQ